MCRITAAFVSVCLASSSVALTYAVAAKPGSELADSEARSIRGGDGCRAYMSGSTSCGDGSNYCGDTEVDCNTFQMTTYTDTGAGTQREFTNTIRGNCKVCGSQNCSFYSGITKVVDDSSCQGG